MQIHKFFLTATVVLLLSFSERGLTMEDDFPNPPSTSRTVSHSEPTVEIKVHILSFLGCGAQKEFLTRRGIF